MRLLLLLFSLFFNSCHAYRYLMIAANIGYSHLEFNGHLADILVEAGHEVDFVVLKRNTFVNGNGSRFANVTHYTPKSLEKLNKLTMSIPFYTDVFQNEVDLFERSNMKILQKLTSYACHDVLADKKFVNRLRSRKYHGAFAEFIDVCSIPLFRLLGIKNVMMTSPTALSEMTAEIVGLPALPSLIPVMNHSPVKPMQMSFLERITNFYYMFRSLYITAPMFYEVFDKPGHIRGTVLPLDFPSWSELRNDITAIFVNTNHLTDLPRPTVHKIHQIGGIALKEPKQLDEKLTQIFESARKGVVLFSFGSIVDTTKMNSRIRDSFLKAFARFPDYEFVWKFVGDQKAAFFNYTNVHTFDWIDQTAILNHPKTHAFISHVGLNSLNEALHFGVPLLAIGFFGDQTYNTAIVDHLQIGIPLSKREIGEDMLVEALSKLLAEKSPYLKRAKKISRMLKAQRTKPAEEFLHQVEFATEFADELRQQRLPDLSLFVYYSLDVISFLALVFLFSLISIFMALRRAHVYLNGAAKLKTM